MNKYEAIELLRSSVGEWNHYRFHNGNWTPDLSHEDFSQTNLRGANLQDANCAGTNFSGCDLTNALFFGNTSCRDANFNQATLENTKFDSSNCQGASFENALIKSASFRKANVSHCSFRESSCWSTDFSDANLTNSDFRTARFLDDPFSPAFSGGCNLQSAQVEGAEFDHDVREKWKPKFTEAEIQKAIADVNEMARKAGISTTGSGKCFVATAACGSEQAKQVLQLRVFRDVVLKQSNIGRVVIGVYELTSPPVAALIRKSPLLRMLVRHLIVNPLSWSSDRVLRFRSKS